MNMAPESIECIRESIFGDINADEEIMKEVIETDEDMIQEKKDNKRCLNQNSKDRVDSYL